MHETFKFDIEDQQAFYDKYTSSYVEGLYGRFLIRRERENDLIAFVNDLVRAYKTAQRQYNNWRDNVWKPLCQEIEDLAVDNKVLLHAKPTHKYKGDQTMWWAYRYSKLAPLYRWGYSFDWIDEPKEKINHELGQRLYDLDRYSKKFSHREYVLKSLLGQYLSKYLYSLYDYQWLHDNQFSEKLVKFTLLGDEYWYRIAWNKSGVPVWENFIWQSSKAEEINL